MFKKEDIQAGYLLCMEDDTGAPIKFATVTMCNYIPAHKEGYHDQEAGLALCTPGDLWFPIDALDDDLQYAGARVVEVWGVTRPKYMLDNETDFRELLWRRGD
jgi:hypothetical protein